MTSKIAVIGAVKGNISAVFNKLASLHSENKFSFAIIAGDLFDEVEGEAESRSDGDLTNLLNGKIEVPLPTYFALGSRSLPSAVLERLRKDGEVCPNLFCLGRRTTIKTSEGVRIVALGGEYDNSNHSGQAPPPDEHAPTYADSDAKILKGATSTDILITSDWPRAIKTGSKVALQDDSALKEQPCIADLCCWLKPKYHFSTSPSFYEREPFFHPKSEDDSGYQVTRFISLAPYGNTFKQKWIYAFSLDPKADLPATIPAGTTASPLTLSSSGTKRKANGEPKAFSRFGDSNGGHHGHRGKKSRGPPPMPSECFFCLSNPNAATHLITSIGDSAYLTTAKGPLSTSKTYSALDFPGHLLIIPLEHTPTAGAISDEESRQATLKEMHRYRKALQTMVSTRCKGAEALDQLGSVTWEISRAGGIHFHWQFMPVERDTVVKGLAEAAFKVQAENESYPRFETTAQSHDGDAAQEVDREDYFRVWISPCVDGDEAETVMTLYLDSSFRFDLQFGRKVMAKLLGLESRSDWRNCGQTEADETADAEAFKRAFKEFDFTMED